jgi:sugar O-acyltransferase (sialic acid O-acetyltransferase NeuD family)
MNKVIIFGTGDIAQLAHYYFSTDSKYVVAAFTVDSEFLITRTFCGLPAVPFEEVQGIYPPSEFELFVAVSYGQLNALRTRKVQEASEKGYRIARYVSSRATILTTEFIGANCFILENNTVQPFVKIGGNVTLWSGNHIGHHSEIGPNCFIASHVVISGGVKIGPNCFIGVNATLRDHIVLGEKCVIGAGALIMSDAPSGSVLRASPTEISAVKSSRLKAI